MPEGQVPSKAQGEAHLVDDCCIREPQGEGVPIQLLVPVASGDVQDQQHQCNGQGNQYIFNNCIHLSFICSVLR